MLKTYNASVAQAPLVSLESNKMRCALEKLDGFTKLLYNWNGNNAEPISPTLIQLARNIISNLNMTPDIFPTAQNSIQMEYEEEGKYLEFEVFTSHINVYYVNDDEDQTYELNTNDYARLNEAVERFYG
jgi:hypothetical protein